MTETETREQYKIYNQLVARSWTDPAFKARLLAEPETVIREAGGTPPAGVSLRAIEVPVGQSPSAPGADDATGYVFIPAKPEGVDDELLGDDDVAGYFSCCSGCNSSPPPSNPPLHISPAALTAIAGGLQIQPTFPGGWPPR